MRRSWGTGYDKEAFDKGYYIQYNKYKLELKYLTNNVVRVFPNEYFTGQYNTAAGSSDRLRAERKGRDVGLRSAKRREHGCHEPVRQ